VAWCREIAIPAAVFAALVTASSPANDRYLAPAAVDDDVTPGAANLPSSESSTAPAGATAAADIDVPVVNSPVMASLERPDELLPAMLPGETVETNSASPQPNDVSPATNSTGIVDECFVIDICVDRYLWQLYQRTPKEDSVREQKQRKITVRKKHRLVAITKTSTTVVDEDFGWKDPVAAKKAGMPLMDYVIGGVDREFKLKLFQMLHAADQAGLAPGITSGFRDDYRQSIANGLKAANNRSYHGGSLRGGYGHGLAADIVSVKGVTRAERFNYSRLLWQWVDDHGNEFGIGRPYLDRDPPHVAPIDGEEYAHHHPGTKARQVAAGSN
jgi:hypothetical protein